MSMAKNDLKLTMNLNENLFFLVFGTITMIW